MTESINQEAGRRLENNNEKKKESNHESIIIQNGRSHIEVKKKREKALLSE
jgi:hypothetical protein